MSELSTRVLLIEDDFQIRRFVRTTLESHGFEVFESERGEQGLIEAGTRKPDLLILDLSLPDLDGVIVIQRLREWSSIPIIVLSARSQESIKIASLDAGADDYLTKPFGIGELLAHIRVALRHTKANPTTESKEFVLDGLRIDFERRRVFLDEKVVHLTRIEYRLLITLIRHAGKVMTHRQLLREVWGPTHAEDSHYVRIYMAQLRHKLEQNPAQPRYLLTETGVGYRFADT